MDYTIVPTHKKAPAIKKRLEQYKKREYTYLEVAQKQYRASSRRHDLLNIKASKACA